MSNDDSLMTSQTLKMTYQTQTGQHEPITFNTNCVTVKGQIGPGGVTVIKGQIKPVLISWILRYLLSKLMLNITNTVALNIK